MTDTLTRFQTISKKCMEDKKCMEEIRDRNIFEIFFSNKTRDLAKAGIAQNELISELNLVCQDVLELIQRQNLTIGDISTTLNDISCDNTELARQFSERVLQTLQLTLEQKNRIDNIEGTTLNHSARISVVEQIRKFRLDVEEISLNKEFSEIKKIEKLLTAIKRYFSDYSLSYNDKRDIMCELEKFKLPLVTIDNHQKVIEYVTDNFDDTMKNKVIAKIQQKKQYPMKEIINIILDSISEESERYISFRDNLINLLNDFQNEPVTLIDSTLNEIIRTKNRLLEDQFEIALIGEFQGGKSTTFNTLCGGREISPRGLNGGGIKTSAAVISAQHIADNEEKNELKEWAELSWLQEDEIKKRCRDIFEGYDNDDEILSMDSDLMKIPQEKINALIISAWQLEKDNEKLDLLKIATLQYKFLFSNELKDLQSKKIVKINEFQQFVKFPIDWTQRWGGKHNSEFTLKEVAFVFLDNVLVRIRSAALSRLGCKITDCPGLFVSSWDTERALEVMKNANAIWYLLNGDKQISQADMRALTRIKDGEWGEKCFFSINTKKNIESTNAIVGADKSVLEQMGFFPEHIFPYNAALSFRAEQAKLCLEKGLSDLDLDCLAEESKKNSQFAEVKNSFSDKNNILLAINKIISRLLINVESTLEDQFYGNILLDESSIALVKSESQIENICNAIEKLMINRRARSILIENGTHKCIRAMNSIVAEFKRQEDDAEITLKEAIQRANSAIEKLKDFSNKWIEKFEFLEDTKIEYALIREFFEKETDSLREDITERGKALCYNIWTSHDYWSNDGVNEAVEKAIQKEFEILLKLRLSAFTENIKKSPCFKKEIDNKLSIQMDGMMKEWAQLQDMCNLFDGIDETLIYDEDFTFNDFNESLSGKIDTPSYSWEFLKDMWTLGLRRIFQTPKDRIDDFFETEKPIEKAFDTFKGNDENTKKLTVYLSQVREKIRKNIMNIFEKMKRDLELNIEEARKRAESSEEEKKCIAKRAKKTREEIIEPYAKRIKDFDQEVSRFYAEAE